MGHVSRGFRGKRKEERDDSRLPPGQYLVEGFPVLSAGPTPYTPLEEWIFSIAGDVSEPKTWSWEDLRALPSEDIRTDIHCVTKWSKLDTSWEGVSLDTLLSEVEHEATHVLAFCDGGYTTNLPLEDVVDGQAWIAFAYDGEPLEPEHGGPARLLVPQARASEQIPRWAAITYGVSGVFIGILGIPVGVLQTIGSVLLIAAGAVIARSAKIGFRSRSGHTLPSGAGSPRDVS